MSFLKSNDVKIFPSGYRGTDEKTSSFDPESRLTTEKNITNLIKSLSINKEVGSNSKYSFVISDNIETTTDGKKILTFCIYGYIFTINIKDYIQSTFNNWTDVYVKIKLDEKQINVLEGLSAQSTYNLQTLIGQGTTGILDTTEDNINYLFEGLNFSDKPFTLNNNEYQLHLLTYDQEEGFYIPEESYLKYNIRDVAVFNSQLTKVKSLGNFISLDDDKFNINFNSNGKLSCSSALQLTPAEIIFRNSSTKELYSLLKPTAENNSLIISDNTGKISWKEENKLNVDTAKSLTFDNISGNGLLLFQTQGNKTSFVNAPEDENYFLGVRANSALLLEPKWKPLSSLKTIKVNNASHADTAGKATDADNCTEANHSKLSDKANHATFTSFNDIELQGTSDTIVLTNINTARYISVVVETTLATSPKKYYHQELLYLPDTSGTLEDNIEVQGSYWKFSYTQSNAVMSSLVAVCDKDTKKWTISGENISGKTVVLKYKFIN